jgi:hypothetical protein
MRTVLACNRVGSWFANRRGREVIMRWQALVFAAAVGVVACSSNGGSSGDVGAFASDYCNVVAKCCAASGLPAGGTTCRALITATASRGTYDPNEGKKCLDALHAAESSADFCSKGLGDTDAACNNVLQSHGSKQPGEACMQTSDCAPSSDGKVTCFTQYVMADGGSSEVRTCVVQLRGKAGDMPCIGTALNLGGGASAYVYSYPSSMAVPARGALCYHDDNLYCDAKTQACAALGMTGATCSTSSDCIDADYCNSQMCMARLADGMPCPQGSQQCQATSSCDANTKQCTAGLAQGAPCTSGSQCQSKSCVNKMCGSSGLGVALLCSN